MSGNVPGNVMGQRNGLGRAVTGASVALGPADLGRPAPRFVAAAGSSTALVAARPWANSRAVVGDIQGGVAAPDRMVVGGGSSWQPTPQKRRLHHIRAHDHGGSPRPVVGHGHQRRPAPCNRGQAMRVHVGEAHRCDEAYASSWPATPAVCCPPLVHGREPIHVPAMLEGLGDGAKGDDRVAAIGAAMDSRHANSEDSGIRPAAGCSIGRKPEITLRRDPRPTSTARSAEGPRMMRLRKRRNPDTPAAEAVN